MPTDYRKMYEKIFCIMGDLTPLKVDCGKLCGGACCKGDTAVGMRLFPFEESLLPVTENPENGVRLAVCDGTCDRTHRPLSCRIFPFFPTVDERGKVFIEADIRAKRLCPLVEHIDKIEFDKRFFKALRKVGRILSKDEECLAFLKETTEEIDAFALFLGENH